MRAGLGHAGVHKLSRTLSQDTRGIRRQHIVQRVRHLLDAGAIVLDHVREPLRDVEVAHERHERLVDQQVFDRGVEIELQLAGAFLSSASIALFSAIMS